MIKRRNHRGHRLHRPMSSSWVSLLFGGAGSGGGQNSTRCHHGWYCFPGRTISSLGIFQVVLLYYTFALCKKIPLQRSLVMEGERLQQQQLMNGESGGTSSIINATATTTVSPGGVLGYSSKLVMTKGKVTSSSSTTTTTTASSIHTSSSFESNYQHALQCLGMPLKNEPRQQQQQQQPEPPLLQYPMDPLDHYRAIHTALAQWNDTNITPHTAAGYSGPWIENYFARHFQPIVASRRLTNSNFSAIFGPYVPIFVPWTSVWVNGETGPRFRYPDELIATLQRVLRPGVLYVTVNQNDDGLPGNDPRFEELLFHPHRRNNLNNTTSQQQQAQQQQKKLHILVLSAGGYGHVPIPLLKQPETPLRSNNNKIPVSERTHFVSYVGSRGNAPQNLRNKMIGSVVDGNQHFYYGKDWRSFMANSKFSLCPRGFGRTSYHVMETLQLGLIPVQVYLDNDIPWLPYYDGSPSSGGSSSAGTGGNSIMEQVGYTTSLSNLPTLLEHLQQTMTDSKIEAMEQRIEHLVDRYFTFGGVMNQIERFLTNPAKADLICQTQQQRHSSSPSSLPQHPATNRPRWFPPPSSQAAVKR